MSAAGAVMTASLEDEPLSRVGTPLPEESMASSVGLGLGAEVESTATSRLVLLAPEVLHRILVHVGRASLGGLAAIAGTCTQLRDLVYNDSDTALWRELHNQLYDDPRGPVHRPRLGPSRLPGGTQAVPEKRLEGKPSLEIPWQEECISRWRVRRRLALESRDLAAAGLRRASASKSVKALKRKEREGEGKDGEPVGIRADDDDDDFGTEEAEGLGLGDMLPHQAGPSRSGKANMAVEVDPSVADDIAQVLLGMYNAIPDPSTAAASLNAAHLIRLINSVAFEQIYRASFRRDSRYALRPIQGRQPGYGRNQGRHDRMDIPHAGLAHLHLLLGWGEESFRKLTSDATAGLEAGVTADKAKPDPWEDPEFGRIHDKDNATSPGRVPASATERVVSRRSRYLQHLGQHRQITYSISHFNERNDFGPLRPDGTVNWPVLDAIAAVMDANVSYVSGRSSLFRGRPAHGWEVDEWRRVPFPDRVGLEGVRAQPLRVTAASRPAPADDGEGDEETSARTEEHEHDWAGIEGTWMGTYAFMDYTDWIQFNYSDLNILDRRPNIDIANYCEAIGQVMRMELTTHMTEFASRLPKIESSIPVSTAMPSIEFCGTSTGGASVEGSLIRGTVSLTTDDPPEVRWTWVVRYSGFDRWRLDGIQVGGCKSRRGIVGMWSDVERADLSPVGPFTYWQTNGEELGSEVDGTFHGTDESGSGDEDEDETSSESEGEDEGEEDLERRLERQQLLALWQQRHGPLPE